MIKNLCITMSTTTLHLLLLLLISTSISTTSSFPTSTPPPSPPTQTFTTFPLPPTTTFPPPLTPTTTTTTPCIPSPPPPPTTTTPCIAPPPIPTPTASATTTTTQSNTTIISHILNTLGFTALSNSTLQANLTTTLPITIFAPSDTSLHTCPTCSLPLLLQEHSIHGLYTLHYLRSLFFGTKIETLSPNRCLTITSSTIPYPTPNPTKKIFINGAEISKPDLFNDGYLIVHGLQGFVSHLSPVSCMVEKMTTLAFPSNDASSPVPNVSLLMLNEAIMKLRVSGYSIVALALREKYVEICELKGLTVFALDDASIFAGKIGHKYVQDIGYHIVPNQVLVGSDLVGLKAFTVLPTTNNGQNLVVTTASGEGPMAAMRINYVKIKNFDLVHNDKIVVHGLSMPFPHVEDQRNSEL